MALASNLLLGIFALLLGLASQNWSWIACGFALCAAIAILWPKGESALLLLPFGYQWLQASTLPLYSAVTGQPLNEFSERGANLEAAVLLVMAGLLALAVGMRLGAGRINRTWNAVLRAEVEKWPRTQMLILSIGAILAGNFMDSIANSAGPAKQFLHAASGLKLAGIFFLAYWCLIKKRDYLILTAVIGSELFVGMLGFFASYRLSLCVFACTVVMANPRISLRSGIAIGLMVTFIAVLGSFWTFIKPNYRTFLNQGAQQQIVDQPLEARLDYLATEAQNFTFENFQTGIEGLIRRFAYIEFFAHTMDYMPAMKPHTGGDQTMGAIRHIFMPRLFFPGKPPLQNDTEVTALYTGLTFHGGDYTSISIGYMGEFYADFGFFGMLISACVLGYALGKCYSLILYHRMTPPIIALSLTCGQVSSMVTFETALVKVVGDVAMAIIAMTIIQRIVLPRVLPFVLQYVRQSSPQHMRGARRWPSSQSM